MNKPDWQPISTAPKDRYILVWPGLWGIPCDLARWNEDEYAKKPKPYWSRLSVLGKVLCRACPPTHWIEFPKPPDGE